MTGQEHLHQRPLSGFRVLDFSRALAGPYCTSLLADLGADVIKIEEPGTGDEARGWGPPFHGRDSAYFLSMNRSKRSMAVNLKAPEGLDLCLQLADRADVVVENFRPGVAQRLGIGYPQLRARRPSLVYCSISAYGQAGPMAQEPGYDLIMQGVGGLMSVTGEAGGRPIKAGVAETDMVAGTNAALAIVGALLRRERARWSLRDQPPETVREPEGEYLDVGLLDGQVLLMGYHIVGHLLTGRVPRPAGNAFPYIVPYQAFQTATFEITVAANSERLWHSFCAAIERPDLLEDPRYATNGDRVTHREALVPVIQEVLLSQPAEYWLGRFSDHGVPGGPINTVDRVAAHPQVQSRELLAPVGHPAGPVRVPTMPWREGEPHSSRFEPPRPAPLLGQHTAEVLQEVLGLTDERISELAEAGAIGLGERPT